MVSLDAYLNARSSGTPCWLKQGVRRDPRLAACLNQETPYRRFV